MMMHFGLFYNTYIYFYFLYTISKRGKMLHSTSFQKLETTIYKPGRPEQSMWIQAPNEKKLKIFKKNLKNLLTYSAFYVII